MLVVYIISSFVYANNSIPIRPSITCVICSGQFDQLTLCCRIYISTYNKYMVVRNTSYNCIHQYSIPMLTSGEYHMRNISKKEGIYYLNTGCIASVIMTAKVIHYYRCLFLCTYSHSHYFTCKKVSSVLLSGDEEK